MGVRVVCVCLLLHSAVVVFDLSNRFLSCCRFSCGSYIRLLYQKSPNGFLFLLLLLQFAMLSANSRSNNTENMYSVQS